MRLLHRPVAALTGLIILASGFTMTAPTTNSYAQEQPASAEPSPEAEVTAEDLEQLQQHTELAPATAAPTEIPKQTATPVDEKHEEEDNSEEEHATAQDEIPTELTPGTPRTDHTFEAADSDFPVRENPEAPHPDEEDHDHGELADDGLVGAAAQGPGSGAAAFSPSRRGNIAVKLVTVKLADHQGTVNANSAINSISTANNYWRQMSNGRLSMSVASTKWGHQSRARSTWSQTDIMNQVTKELGWRYSPYTALVVYTPSGSLANGTLGYGWSSNGTSGRILMPQISNFTTNVITHEFGHVLGFMHADALQCTKGQPDIKSFTGSGCHIKEYGDTMDLMGAAQTGRLPAISASFWDYGGMGRGDEITNAGVVSGSKTWKLLPWAGTAKGRAVKFTDPRSKEVYYIEFRAPVSYDASSAHGGNYGVKITQSGGATPASSLILMPSTKPFSGFYAANHAWKAGWTFTTHGGTKVRINSLSGSTSASITITAPGGTTAPKPVAKAAFTDMNRNGTADIVARDKSGVLWLYPTTDTGAFLSRVRMGSGWASMTAILQPGDFNGDKIGDIIARDKYGNLFLYAGTGTGGLRAGVKIGHGWQVMTALITPGDFNGDGRADLIARDSSGKLFLYAGNGKGGFSSSAQIGSGWQGFTSILSTGDFNGDGKADILARDKAGSLYLYRGNGSRGFLGSSKIGHGWQGFTALSGPGYWSKGDNNTDILARASNGELTVYWGNGKGGFIGSRKIGSGWNAMSMAPTVTPVPKPAAPPAAGARALTASKDMNGDGTPDLIARDAVGRLWLYPTKTTGVFAPKKLIGTGWGSMTAILQPGDFDGDKKADIIARTKDGQLMLYPGTGAGAVSAGVRIGTGWQSLTSIATVGDFNRSGSVDLIARDAAGSLYLYPGDGLGGFEARTKIGSGWAGMGSIIGAGHFNGDLNTDLLARDKSGMLHVYPGDGRGGFGKSTRGSGWSAVPTIVGPGAWAGSDQHADMLGRKANGDLFLYTGNGRGGFTSAKKVGAGWQSLDIAP